MFVEVICIATNSSDAKKLAVWDTVFASLWVCRVISQVIMGISRFAIEVCLYSIVFEYDFGVKKSHF